ncbi:hypothetical protein GCM10010329_77990 [Streptomyces spiroverticillatus]|uniref:HNH endonuclease n=1 Tax=Streptomyces finlayi TaxID=67296 RepID=A0A918X598_9ACTN|nr:hypothetical protein [Streptomyces finlayi]GHA43504.1 hypothetical protein GCM10010329_77990 [Streptomyces spiroverticillatus]GHD13339.1 hypothetical protein GCM10010334_71360 [Streptomyces finlayi]
MGFEDVDVIRLAGLPCYPAADRPAGAVTLGELTQYGLERRRGGTQAPTVWLVEAQGGGFRHRLAYGPLGLAPAEPLADASTDKQWRAIQCQTASRMVALEAKELLARARYRAGLVEDRSRNGMVLRPRRRPYETGHPLVVAARTAACCGRLTELAVRSVYERISEHYLLRSEPGPLCEPEQHPGQGVYFAEILPQLEKLVAHRAKGEGVFVWGAAPLLALYAEVKIARGTVRRKDTYRLRGRWHDLQADEARWRTGEGSLRHLRAFPAGDDAAGDAAHLVTLVHEIAESFDIERSADDYRLPLPGPSPAPPVADEYLLPCVIGTAAPLAEAPDVVTVPARLLDGPTDTSRVSRGRREQPLLRQCLLRQRIAAPCSLCGDTYPSAYLRAAHIKRRAEASEDERRDLAVGMLACTFGCDQMFELGDIFVEDDGTVGGREQTGSDALDLAIGRIAGRRFLGFASDQRPYFRHHRQAHGHEPDAP